MSFYMLGPCPPPHTAELDCVTRPGVFSRDEVERIVALGEARQIQRGTVGQDLHSQGVRSAQVSWFVVDDETRWVYDRLAQVFRQVNGENFQFELFGFWEDLQYTVYSDVGDHYTWHVDRHWRQGVPARKLSVVVQLSDPAAYQGGDLELRGCNGVTRVSRELGLACIFPAFVLHRVTPLLGGTRRSLVAWVSGPQFR